MKSYKELYSKYSKMKKEDLVKLLISRDRAIETVIKNNDQVINLGKDFERINESIKKYFKDEQGFIPYSFSQILHII